MFDLDGRVAIVTGASSGLGEGVARTLASAGARVAVVARRKDRLDAIAAEIGGLAVGWDLGDPAALDGLVEQVANELGAPEILVNAAGMIFNDQSAEDEPLSGD